MFCDCISFDLQDWALGLLHTKCVCGAVWLGNSPLKQNLDRVCVYLHIFVISYMKVLGFFVFNRCTEMGLEIWI